MSDGLHLFRLQAISRGYHPQQARGDGRWVYVGIARRMHGCWVEGVTGRTMSSPGVAGWYDADTQTVTPPGGRPQRVTYVRRSTGV